MNDVNWANVFIGSLACAAGPACIVLAIQGYYGAVGAILIACAIEVALLWARRLEQTGRGNQAASARGGFNSRRPDHYTPYHEPITGMH